MGFSGNLTVGEILEQVVHADRLLAEEWQTRLHRSDGKSSKLDLVRNIVFMGMGEVRGRILLSDLVAQSLVCFSLSLLGIFVLSLWITTTMSWRHVGP